jgi:5-(carboxyamino)imidazole ribonucleotide synthase
MFAMAAQKMGYIVHGFTPETDSPLSQVCTKTIVAPFEDQERLKAFADSVDLVTIEFENIPVASLALIESRTRVRPGPRVLDITQHRLREKTFLDNNGFPIVPFKEVNSSQELSAAIALIGVPSVLKTAGFGYDGKGQRKISANADAGAAFEALGKTQCILERFVEFEKEVSVIGARSEDGRFISYGPIENQHSNHILDVSLVLARLARGQAQEAVEITRTIMECLEMTGLLCVEFFVVDDRTLLVNELAPRPHNSGHYSIEGCSTSQFEQHVRAVAGLPFGDTEPLGSVAMANLLGDLWQQGEPDWAGALASPAVHLHLYGKQQPRPGRKMGHLTALAADAETAERTVRAARAALVDRR